MTVRELIVKLGFEVEHEKLSKLEEQLEGVKRRLEFLGAAEIAKGVFELTERFSKFAEELHAASESAGITVESLQKLGFAAQQSNISQEELGGSMARLARRLYEAKTGSQEAQKAFVQAGISTAQIQGFKTGQDALLALSDRFKTIQDPIKKQALAMELLGRGSVNMVGFLSRGSAAIKGMGDEASKLGVVLSTQQIEALVEVEHGMQKLWAVVKSVSATIAANLAPSINYVIDEVLKFYQANQKLITGKLSEWIYDVLYGLGFLFGVLETITKKIYEFSQSHPLILKLATAFGIVALAIIAINLGVQKLIFTFVKLGEVGSASIKLLSSPFSLWILALAGIFIALHDIWNAFQGKPTWIGSFIAWLGIAQQVQDVCFAIFDIISDILNLDFSKLFKDVLGDAKSLGKIFDSFKNGVVNSVSGAAKSIYGFFDGTSETDKTPDGSPEQPGKKGISKVISGILNPGAGGISSLAANAIQNVQSAPDVLAPPSQTSSETSNQDNSSRTTQYSVNAPITINVEGGTDHKVVGDKVKEGVKEHLDRVYRETQRSLRPVQAY